MWSHFCPEGQTRSGRRKSRPCPAQYATISNKFNVAIERGTFKSLNIKSEELETLAQTLTPNRQGLLQYLGYSVLLPPIDTAVSERFERPAETKAVSKLFSVHMNGLFDTLRHLDGLKDLWLCLLDVAHSSRTDDNEMLLFEENDELGYYRYLRSRTNLLRPDTPPQLKCISHLTLGSWERTPTSSAPLDLAARMPKLVTLYLEANGAEIPYPGLLREDRHSLATTLKLRSEETKTVSGTTIDLAIDGGATNQMLPIPNLTYP